MRNRKQKDARGREKEKLAGKAADLRRAREHGGAGAEAVAEHGGARRSSGRRRAHRRQWRLQAEDACQRKRERGEAASDYTLSE